MVAWATSRRLLLDNGVQLPARRLAERLLQQAAAQGRRTAWTRVYLSERVGEPLYLVCRVLPGRDHPLMLLTSLTVENLEAASPLRFPIALLEWWESQILQALSNRIPP